MTETPALAAAAVRSPRRLLARVLRWRRVGADGRGAPAPIVPGGSLAGTALIVVIAIMAFLAAMTVGGLDLVRQATSDWNARVAREVTIQILPVAGRDTDAAVAAATAIAKATPGIGEVHPFSLDETRQLLAPWLGNAALTDLPVPRLISAAIASGAKPDLAALSSKLTSEVAGASLDDHRAWIDRLRAVGDTLVGIGAAVLALVVTATALSVLFATRGAMAGNRDIIEVLHLVGARDGFVARSFARRFFSFGLKGGLVGGGIAIVLFVLAAWLGGGADDQLLGPIRVGVFGYLGTLAVVALIAFLAAATSRMAVMSHLKRLD
ncbi:MAG TPA: ABC transporter permease [Hyphomicrobiales bacterium]|nr:ABC transporter permease [Hyphomicrobiales bacterium]